MSGHHLTADSSFDKIRSFVIGNTDSLPPHLEEIRQRWSAAFTLMLDKGLKCDRVIANQLMTTFGISESQAYSDITMSRRLFGDARRSSKEAERYVASENAKQLFEKAWSMFMATKKHQWFVAAVSQQKLHARINCLDKDDPELPDPSKINPPTQILQINIDFLTSQFAQVIDPKAKEKINALLSQVEELIRDNRIGDYLDTTVDIPHIEVK